MPLINAAKKHQTDVRYCVKKIVVIKQERKIHIPNKCIFLILEMKNGVIVTIIYTNTAIIDVDFGKLVLY